MNRDVSTQPFSAGQEEKDPEKGDSSSEDNAAAPGEHLGVKKTENRKVVDGKRIITEEECWDALGYSWPSWKKWMLISSIFAVQLSMNFNTSVYPNAVPLLAEHFNVSQQAARVGQMIFLVLYAFGCELWAPWSEEFGRWPILQYVVWNPCASKRR